MPYRDWPLTPVRCAIDLKRDRQHGSSPGKATNIVSGFWAGAQLVTGRGRPVEAKDA